MSDTGLHLKMDRVLSRLDDQGRRQDGFEAVLETLTEGLRGLIPLFGQQREMLTLILEAATAEPAGDGELTAALQGIATSLAGQTEALVGIQRTLQALPDAVESATGVAIRSVMAEAEAEAEPPGNGHAGAP